MTSFPFQLLHCDCSLDSYRKVLEPQTDSSKLISRMQNLSNNVIYWFCNWSTIKCSNWQENGKELCCDLWSLMWSLKVVQKMSHLVWASFSQIFLMYVAQDTVSRWEENVLTLHEFPVFKTHRFCKTMSFWRWW